MNLPEERKKLLKELAIVSAIAIPIVVELVYQICMYVRKRRKDE